jgi:hypothetical protein
MPALKKWQDGRTPPSQIGPSPPDSGIAAKINQASVQHFDCFIAPVSGQVDFRQVQIELRFISPQTQGLLA